MSGTIKLSEIRAKFPMYADLSNDQLISGIRKKYYPDIPIGEFTKRIEYDTERADPTADMGGVQKFIAGYGKAVPDMVRGIGQLVGAVDQSTVDEAKRIDAPLMKTGAGMAGNIGGNIAATLPAAFIPGAATIPGAAVVGGSLGAIQPVASDESRLANIGVGALAGPAGVLLGRGVAAGYQGVKALAEPFTEAGRSRIAGRMIQRFADDPASIAAATSKPTITGARPTLAEQTGDAGLARLQDSLRATDPQFNNAIAGRLADNNAARVNALLGLTGEDGARDFAVANRDATAETLYEAARRAGLPALTAKQQAVVADLMKRPAVKGGHMAPGAMDDASVLARNEGLDIKDPAGSIQGLDYVKRALDDKISKATGNEKRILTGIKEKLVGLLDEISPDYAAARKTYAAMSKPVNSMDIAAEVAKRGLSKGSDLAGNQTINRNALLGALRDEQALIRRATGRNVGNALADVMEPQDLNLLRSIASEADRAGAVATAGNGPGSATAQRMASQNVLRQIIGPTGLPQSWAENALANTVVGKPLNLVYGGIAEPKIQQSLARAILDPDQAQAVIQAAQQQGIKLPPSTMKLLLAQAARSAAPATAVPGQR